MIYDYIVTLRNQNSKYIDNISILLLLVSAIFFLVDQLKHGFTLLKSVACFFTIAVLAWNLYAMLRLKRKQQYSRGLLVAGMGWFTMPVMFWLGLPLIALGLLEKLAKSNLEIGFTAEGIVFNNLFKRRYRWSAFNNIMLKDDLLTMDFRDNRILQRLTIEDEPDADEDEFNQYCLKHLSPRI